MDFPRGEGGTSAPGAPASVASSAAPSAAKLRRVAACVRFRPPPDEFRGRVHGRADAHSHADGSHGGEGGCGSPDPAGDSHAAPEGTTSTSADRTSPKGGKKKKRGMGGARARGILCALPGLGGRRVSTASATDGSDPTDPAVAEPGAFCVSFGCCGAGGWGKGSVLDRQLVGPSAGDVDGHGAEGGDSIAWDVDGPSGSVRFRSTTATAAKTASAGPQHRRCYSVDGAYGCSSSSMPLYTAHVRPLVRSVVEGYDALLLMHGAPGTGRTHAMTGTPSDPGVAPLAVTDLFRNFRRSQQARGRRKAAGRRYKLRVSYLEVRGEEVRDLLVPIRREVDFVNHVPGTGLTVDGDGDGDSDGEDGAGRSLVQCSPTEVEASSPERVFRILARGMGRRAVSRNREAEENGGGGIAREGGEEEEMAAGSGASLSSPFSAPPPSSHTVIRLLVECRLGPECRRTSTLTLVDLGGWCRGGGKDDEGLRSLEALVRRLSSSDSDSASPAATPPRNDDNDDDGLSFVTAPSSPSGVTEWTDRDPSPSFFFLDPAQVDQRAAPQRPEVLSKLCRLLRPALSVDGTAHVCVVCTASPLARDVDDTVRTLQFAERVRRIPTCPFPNDEEYDEPAELRLCRDEVVRLREQLARAKKEEDRRREVEERANALGREVERLRAELEGVRMRKVAEEEEVDGGEGLGEPAHATAAPFRAADVPGGPDGISCGESGLHDAVRCIDNVIQRISASQRLGLDGPGQSTTSATRRSRRMSGRVRGEARRRKSASAALNSAVAVANDAGANCSTAGSSRSKFRSLSWTAVGATGDLLDADFDTSDSELSESSLSSASFVTATGRSRSVSFHASVTSAGQIDAGSFRAAWDSGSRFGDAVETKGEGGGGILESTVASWEDFHSMRSRSPGFDSTTAAKYCTDETVEGKEDHSLELDNRSAVSSLTGATTVFGDREALDPSILIGELYRIQGILCSVMEREERRVQQLRQLPPDGAINTKDRMMGEQNSMRSFSSIKDAAARAEIISRLWQGQARYFNSSVKNQEETLEAL